VLRQQLATVSGLPPVHYEGRTFTPVVGQRFVREQLLTFGAVVETMGREGLVREEIAYRLTVFSPVAQDATMRDHDDVVDTLRAAFPLAWGVHDQAGTLHGLVTESERGMTVADADWRQTTITIFAYYHRARGAA